MRHAKLLALSAAAAVGLPLARATAIDVIFEGPNVQTTLGLPYAQVEDPALGQPIGGCFVIEWRDADYVGGAYKDWVNSGIGSPDGHPNEVWLRSLGQAITTTTTVNSTSVAIHLVGDNNDGLANIFVDGLLVAQLDMYTPSPPADTAVVLVSNLPFGTHTIEVDDRGQSNHPQGGDDVAVLGASACGQAQLFPKWRQFPHPPQEGFNVPSWLDWLTFANQVVADDFCSDGRVITHVRWWGSYIEPFFEPICEPTNDGLGCEPIVCPNPLDSCVPVAIEYSQVTGLGRVIECECRDPGGCQVWWSGVPFQEPICIGTCPPGLVCHLEIENFPGGIQIYRCVCVPLGASEPPQPGTGACCLPGNLCDDTIDENQCAASGGLWIPGVSCAQQPCGALGACCVDDACIGDFTFDACLEQGGDWYFGQSCEFFICPTGPNTGIDGWLISFHSDQPEDPPLFPYSQPKDLLGLYFAPRDAITIEPLGYAGWDGHPVYEYFVALQQCCLIHSFEDPRTGTFPAQDGRFEEVRNVIYWIDIQAVTGHTWLPPECFGEDTGNFFEFPFWGWHTSPDFWNDLSVTGVVVMLPGNIWIYEGWIPVDGTPHMLDEVHQAFVLMTPEEPLCFCRADITGPCGPGIPDGNVDALDFLLLIAQWGTAGPEADITGPGNVPDGVVDALDFLLLIAQWGSPGNCPDECPTPE